MLSPSNELLLPDNVKPVHYSLYVMTDLYCLTFQGFVAVDLNILRTTANFTFHAKDVNLIDISVMTRNSELQTKTYSIHQDRVVVELPEKILEGEKAQLRVHFNGSLQRGSAGYFYCKSRQEGKELYYATTQFEPTSARRVFPCWDEPSLKATYDINLISRANTINLSNMPVKSEGIIDTNSMKDFEFMKNWPYLISEQWKLTQFESTPLISSYLIAFANGPFGFIETRFKSPLTGSVKPVRMYSAADDLHQAHFALDITAKSLSEYEEAFGIEYPLPKLDTLLCDDFDVWGMENWGFIVCRKSVLMLDPKDTGITARRRIVELQCHEVAHMWFGNITTMHWWDNLYLNEGFATLMGDLFMTSERDKAVLIKKYLYSLRHFLPLDKLYPEWSASSEFILRHVNTALRMDAKLSSHPVEMECRDPDMITQVFDALSYAKAASVLRMLQDVMGEATFFKGVSTYLNSHLYGNATTQDLWKGMSSAIGLDIAALMKSWIMQTGYPIITVTETSSGIRVRQSRFVDSVELHGSIMEHPTWKIPLNIIHCTDTDGVKIWKRILEEDEAFIPLDVSKTYKLNAYTNGVYRVQYPDERLHLLALEAVEKDSVLSTEDCIGLVHDAFALGLAGFSQVSSALQLVQTMAHRECYLIWKTIQSSLDDLTSLWWGDDAITELLWTFRQQIFYKLAETSKMNIEENEDTDKKQLRILAISETAKSGDKKTIKDLLARFHLFLQDGNELVIPADYEDIVYETAVRNGGQREFDAMLELYKNPARGNRDAAVVIGLSSTEDSGLIEDLFKFLLSGTRDHDIVPFFNALARNNTARRRLAEFTMQNFDALYERLSEGFLLSMIIKPAFSFLTSVHDADKISAFFAGKDCSKFSLTLEQSLESIRTNSAFIERSSDNVKDWLLTWKDGMN